MDRGYWLRRIDELDLDRDYLEIARITAAIEFPWDVTQALSFALFRTYAVPSIGGLLARTGEFTGNTQKRYDDTVLLLDAVLQHGFADGAGRKAIRRVNQMHGSYGISNDDLRYVLSTFVVIPKRWLDDFGWRPLTTKEGEASARYYPDLGRHMGIKDLPATYQEFESLMDAYEAEHFGYDEGARRVADATLDLLTTFPPHQALPKRLVRKVAFALMDDHLLEAFRYPRPHPAFRRAVRQGLRARASVVRRRRPRTTPLLAQDLPQVRTYPRGYEVEDLGTFPS
ncbi:MAG: DUF2236 domain-containing protein [Actinomycetota bacterium]|nr:DUF2236 domain-containing protein [Actinomycetota bacterium]